MIKIKKQVSIKKTAQFFNNKKYVLFFHYNGDTELYSSLIKNKLVGDFSVTPLWVKNKLAERFLAKNEILRNQTGFVKTESQGICSHDTQPDCSPFNSIYELKPSGLDLNRPSALTPNKKSSFHGKQNIDLNTHKLEKDSNSEKDLTGSLFHGPTILLAVNDLKEIHDTVFACKNQKLFVLLAAFYEQTILNHSQVERLVELSRNSLIHSKAIKNISQPANSLVNIFTNCLFLELIQHYPTRLSTILRIQKHR